MGTGSWFDTTVNQPVKVMVDEVMVFLPRLAGALLLFLIGWLVAKGIEAIVVRALKTLALDKLSEQIQLSSVLTKGGIKRKLSELVGVIVYWLVMLAVVVVV